MKNLPRAVAYAFLVLLVVCIVSNAFAGDKKISKKDVPAAALKAFEAAFPRVKVNSYLQEVEDGKTYIEFETIEGTNIRDILYTADGTLVEVEEKLTAETVPSEIVKAITADMPKAKIMGGERTTKGNEVTFDIRVRAGRKIGTIRLSADGKIVKKVMMKAKKEKKTEKEKEEKEEKEEK